MMEEPVKKILEKHSDNPTMKLLDRNAVRLAKPMMKLLDKDSNDHTCSTAILAQSGALSVQLAHNSQQEGWEEVNKVSEIN